MSENVNQILETKQGISIYHMTDEDGKVTKLKRNHNPERIIAIIEHQNEKETENAKLAISVFADKEKEQIKSNPDDFIKPTT
jgi:Na+-transporting NADH:ubiquinone oxidoreductase subunit NqrA